MSFTAHEKEEADAFNKRISERVQAGFIPDLRRIQRCEYFYKSFWRDPKFTDLYVGEMYRNYTSFIKNYIGPNAKILDVGCGAGYFALELARDGHHVLGIDVADEAITEANNALKENPFWQGFGSLSYQTSTIYEVTESEFDVILYSGVLHHLDNLQEILNKTKGLLKPSGIVICHEPCHEKWQDNDAAIVAIIRSLLALTGYWFEDDFVPKNETEFLTLIADIKEEYQEERDKSELGQSPHDNHTEGAQILTLLNTEFKELAYKPSSSFIYRVLGGLRGTLKDEYKLAEFIALCDKTLVNQKLLNPNYFYFVGRNNHEV